MYDLSHFTGQKAGFFPDRHILIKRSLNMILSQNKHSVALKLYIQPLHIFSININKIQIKQSKISF